MKTEYPSLIYNNKDQTSCTVENEYQRKCLEGYFKDSLDHDKMPYQEIKIDEAMNLHRDAKAEAEFNAGINQGKTPVEAVDMDALRASVRAEMEAEDAEEIKNLVVSPAVEMQQAEGDPPSKSNKPLPEKKDVKKLGWNELRTYAKEIAKATGVEIDLGATRPLMETAINGVLNGSHYRRSDKEGVSQA